MWYWPNRLTSYIAFVTSSTCWIGVVVIAIFHIELLSEILTNSCAEVMSIAGSQELINYDIWILGVSGLLSHILTMLLACSSCITNIIIFVYYAAVR